MLEQLRQDITYGFRQLRKSPGFTFVAVASLALGIGANTAIFELVAAIRMQTLPVENPEQLVSVEFQKGSARSGWFSTRSARLTYAQWDHLRKNQQAFSSVLAWSAARFNLSDGGEARWAEGLYVSGDFFRTLGVNPLIGRTITSADDTDTCPNPGAVVSYAFWQRELGGDRSALGRSISLDGHTFPVIGITKPEFFGVEMGRRYDVAIPVCADRMMSDDGKGRIPIRHAWWLSMMGRLKPGWTVEKARAQMRALSPGLTEATMPPVYKAQQAKKYLANKMDAQEGGTGVSNLRRQYEQPLWLLMATTGLVLLIACANLANLLLARASVRERELAVRLALGASRGRLIRQLLAESLLLALMGATLGAGLAQLLSRGLIAFISTKREPLFLHLGLDWRVLGFTAALAVGTCLLFGLLPALRATSMAPSAAIRAGGRSMTSGPERFSLRRILVVTQVAFSLVLLTGALLFVRSLRNLMTTDSGFKPEGIMTVGLDFSRGQYPKERRPALSRELSDKLSALPGVQAAAQVMMTPISGSGWNNDIGPDGTQAAASGKQSFFNRVGPGYFHTMGTQLLAGREFDERDNLSGPKVAVVNEVFARKFFGKANVVGRTFRMEAPAGKPEDLVQIVGVVKNTKYYELREDFLPIGFFPMAQDDDPGSGLSMVLRVQGSPLDLMTAVKGAVAGINPTIGIEFRTFSAQLEESLLRDRLMATLSGAFALLAGLLAMLGLYGVIAYMVARRRNEIGLRIALGANRARVIRLVLAETGLLLVVGLGVGVLLAQWAARGASSMLYGLQPYDPVSTGISIGVLAIVGLCAGYGPARRAAGLEPMAALREE
ncbi:ABC transporter permease [uncultured Paludibaculum sp.]|uniref:ABC transporter permease n=1 Tax=uncultured Paludibaculum sp. TaxID=1765020 RepID=UPI002AAAF383|nr:ABC transporter permease [uncultured Paludibaculum sp.]